MILTDRWDGSGDPFQGDRTLRLLVLPGGARVARARVRVEPVPGNAADPFVERLSFAADAPAGLAAAQLAHAAGSTEAWTEIDLRGRRTLRAVEGDVAGARLHVDLGGGVFVPIDAAGGIAPSASGAATLGASPAPLPGVAATRLRLVKSAAPAPAVSAVLVRGAPSGVTLRLGDDAPFWVFPGELTAPAETQDFAVLLEAWLAAHGREELGGVPVPLVVHTETPGRLRVTVEVDAWLQAALLPAPVREATFPFDFATHSVRLPGTATWAGDLSARLPANARAAAGATRLRLLGSFGETRVVAGRGPTGVVDPREARGRALVSSAYAQAQEIPPGAEARIVGVDLLLRPATRAVELQLDLRSDLDGRPDRPLLPTPVRFRVDQGEEAVRPVWVGAALAEPFRVDAGTRYWVVLQALSGEAEWVAYPHAAAPARRLDLTGLVHPTRPDLPALLNTDDGGLSWRSGGPLVALFRLRGAPPRFTVPLQLEAGSGVDAVRVPLSRFDPLGRVDFVVDDELLAGAVSAAARVAAGPCPPGETLADGAFAEWTAQGDALGEPVPVVGVAGTKILHLAVAPDGRYAYALGQRAAKPVLLRIDVPSARVVDTAELKQVVDTTVLETAIFIGGEFTAFVVHPDGSRACVLTQPSLIERGLVLQVVELETGAEVGAPRIVGREIVGQTQSVVPSLAGAFSPDGATLHVAARDVLFALDLFAPGREGAAVPIARFEKRLGGNVVCMAAAGGRLCVGTVGRLLHVFDLSARDPADLGGPLPALDVLLSSVPTGVAVAPDGKLAAVTYRRSASGPGSGVVMVDLERGTELSVQGKLAVAEALAAVVAPGGNRAYVAGLGALGMLDPARRILGGMTLPDATQLFDLVITPGGDRLLAAYRDGNGVTGVLAIDVGTRTPVRWTASGAAAIGAPRGERPRGVVLGSPHAQQPEPASLSQVVRVGEGCRYAFSFEALSEADAAAVAELIWTGRSGELLDLESFPLAASATFATVGDEGRALRPHRRLRTAPPGATHVEVRFRAPAGQAEVAGASFTGTAERVVNGDFRLPLRDDDGGWEPVAGTARAVVGEDPGGGTVLRSPGPAAAELAQEVAAAEGTPLALRFEGRAWASPGGQSPALRVRWLDAGGRETGAAALHPVLDGDFPLHPLRLDPPKGTVRASVALVVPPRAALHARALSLLEAPEVEVPLRFIAEAPGELTVTDAWVGYDLAADAAAGGVPVPLSPPGGNGTGEGGGEGEHGGEDEGDDECCEPCGDDPGGAAAGGSAKTGTGVSARARRITLGPSGIRWPRLQSAPATSGASATQFDSVQIMMDERATVPPAPGAGQGVTEIPVGNVQGVGPVRERRLVDAGIRTAERLAAATPEELQQIDPRLARDIATALIDAAARLV